MSTRHRFFLVLTAVVVAPVAPVAMGVRPADDERAALVKVVSDEVASPAFGTLHFDESCWDARVSTVDPAYAAVTLEPRCAPKQPADTFADVAWILTGGGSAWKTDFLGSPQCHQLEKNPTRAAIDRDLFGEAPCRKLLEPRGDITFVDPPTFVPRDTATFALVEVHCPQGCRVRLDGSVRVKGRLVGTVQRQRFVLCDGKELCASQRTVTAPSPSPRAIDRALANRQAVVMRMTITVTNIASKRSASYVATGRVKRGKPAPG